MTDKSLLEKLEQIFEAKYLTGEKIQLNDTVKIKDGAIINSDKTGAIINSSLLSDYQLWMVKSIGLFGGDRISLSPIDRDDDLLDVIVSVKDVVLHKG